MDWGSLANAIAGSAAPWVNGLFNLVSTHKTNKANKENVEDTNEAQIAMAREQMQFQEEQLGKQQDFAHDEAELAYQRELNKMQLENQYNSPIEQLQRYQQAGINPSVAFAGNVATAAASSGGSAPQASAPSSGVSPSMPVLTAPHEDRPMLATGIMDGLVKSAQIAKEFAEAAKTKEEARMVQKYYESTINNLQADTEGKKLSNLLTAQFGADRETANIANLSHQALLAEQQGETERAKRISMQVQDELNKTLAGLNEAQKHSVELRNNTYMAELKASLEVMRSQAESNRASAAYSREALLTSATEREKFAQETLQAIESTRSISLDNEKREKLLPLIIKQIELDIRQQGQDYWNPFRYAGTIFGGAAGATIKAIAK